MAEFARQLNHKKDGSDYAKLASRAHDTFEAAFWNEELGCLYDVIGDDGIGDPAIRPNQIFALSLPGSLLSREKEASVLKVVSEHLLTPHGLRSLSPSDPAYTGAYGGGPLERDGAYHQGTVWGWLIGPYVDACLSVHGESPKVARELLDLLGPLLDHLDHAGIGQVSEIFDGDAPHAPRGCFAQAWSVSELLRVVLRLNAIRGTTEPSGT